MNTIILVLITAAAAAMAVGYLRARRRSNEKQLLKTEIKTWEGEGGNMPEVPTVTPVVKPQTSAPPRP